MMLTEILGKHLKSSEVLGLLEAHQAGPVIYEFDRLEEGAPDSYIVEAFAAGFELWFNENQRLTTIHCYVQGSERFSKIPSGLLDVPLHATPADVESASVANGLRVVTGSADLPELLLETTWARVEAANHWIHYEFRSGILSQITFSLPS